MKQCYYELLEVDRKATGGDIKTVLYFIIIELSQACAQVPSR